MSRSESKVRGAASVTVGLILSVAVAAAQQTGTQLVIDPSSPYVQIKLDHAGKRKPLSEFEPPFGLWLRLKNNSTVAIRVVTFEPGTSDQGVGVADEVLETRSSVVLGTAREPDHPTVQPGRGYSFDVGSPAIIAPGKTLLFSVPLSHVGPTWYLRLRFDFVLPPVKGGRQPYSFVDFTWSDVPQNARQLWFQSQVP